MNETLLGLQWLEVRSILMEKTDLSYTQDHRDYRTGNLNVLLVRNPTAPDRYFFFEWQLHGAGKYGANVHYFMGSDGLGIQEWFLDVPRMVKLIHDFCLMRLT